MAMQLSISLSAKLPKLDKHNIITYTWIELDG